MSYTDSQLEDMQHDAAASAMEAARPVKPCVICGNEIRDGFLVHLPVGFYLERQPGKVTLLVDATHKRFVCWDCLPHAADEYLDTIAEAVAEGLSEPCSAAEANDEADL